MGICFTKGLIVERKLKELAKYIYSDTQELNSWDTKEGVYSGYGEYAEIDSNSAKISISERWGCKDYTTRWFQKKVIIPEKYNGKAVVLLLDFGGEGIVKINDEIVSSLTACISDRNEKRHRVFVTKSAIAGEKIKIEAEMNLNYMEFATTHRMYGKEETYYTFAYAKIAVLNELVEDFYFDLKTAYESLCVLQNPLTKVLNSVSILPPELQNILESSKKDSYIAERLEMAIGLSLNEVAFNFDDKTFINSLINAKDVLQKEIEKIPSLANMTITFTGQGHIDTAWRWVIHESVRKTRNTMANVIDLMDRYPDFVFAFSQPQLFEFVKDHYPDLYDKMKEKVKANQLELIGNSWVEMDANIPSGESLVRQLLYGTQFFKNEFGKASKVFWMPDVFGYSWALPQIIKRSGMEYFFTSKLWNNDTNLFPLSLFQWQGIDGTKIMAYVQRLNYNGIYDSKTVDSLYHRFPEKKHTDELLMTFGFGDGGGGPTYEMLETGKRLKKFPGFQKTRLGTAESFFKYNDKNFEKFPVWNDEMYFEHHRGTYTTQANTKKANRKNELLYRGAEFYATLANKFNGQEYPYADFLKGYKKLLTNQFHDILPGSSIKEVYKFAKEDYDEIESIGKSISRKSVDSLTSLISHMKNDVIIFNALSWNRCELVQVIVDSADISICDASTKTTVPHSVKVIDGKTVAEFLAVDVPSLGYKVFNVVSATKSALSNACIAQSKNLIENDYYIIKLNDFGDIISIFDKNAARSVFIKSENPSVLKIFEDKPANETAWNIDLEYQNKEWMLVDGVSELTENSDLKAVVTVRRVFNKSIIEQDIIVYKDSRRIDFVTRVNWQETEKMLKAEFNVDVHSSKATYEIQFGAIERPTHWNTCYDKAKFEVCGHKWADLSEGDYGVSILNDCKYGYDIKDNRMRITLLRSTIDPDFNADKGEHTFTYSLLPHENDWRHGDVVQEAYGLNVPLQAIVCKNAVTGVLTDGKESFFTCDMKNVVVDTVKTAEDGNGVIIRVYESIGRKSNVNLSSFINVNSVQECNLMEDNESNIEVKDNSFSFQIKPFEVKTFRLV